MWATYNEETAGAFVAAIVDAINWIEQNQEAAKPIVSKYTEIPEHAVPAYHFTENGKVRIEDVQFWLDYLLERGDRTEDWLSVEEIATDQYNPAK